MQGIGCASDERMRVANAVLDEALGVLTRKRHRTRGVASRAAPFLGPLVFVSFPVSRTQFSGRQRFRTPAFQPRATCSRCHLRRLLRRGRTSAREDDPRPGGRTCTPPAFLTGNRPKRTPRRRRRLRWNTRPRRHRESSSCRASRGSPNRRQRCRFRRRSMATRSARTSQDRRIPPHLRFPTRRGRSRFRSRFRKSRRRLRFPRRRLRPRSRSQTSRPPTHPGGCRRRRRPTRESDVASAKRRKRVRMATSGSGVHGAFPASTTPLFDRKRVTDVKTRRRRAIDTIRHASLTPARPQPQPSSPLTGEPFSPFAS